MQTKQPKPTNNTSERQRTEREQTFTSTEKSLKLKNKKANEKRAEKITAS